MAVQTSHSSSKNYLMPSCQDVIQFLASLLCSFYAYSCTCSLCFSSTRLRGLLHNCSVEACFCSMGSVWRALDPFARLTRWSCKIVLKHNLLLLFPCRHKLFPLLYTSVIVFVIIFQSLRYTVNSKNKGYP